MSSPLSEARIAELLNELSRYSVAGDRLGTMMQTSWGEFVSREEVRELVSRLLAESAAKDGQIERLNRRTDGPVYYAEALDLVADELKALAPEKFNERRDKIIAIVVNAAHWYRQTVAESAARQATIQQLRAEALAWDRSTENAAVIITRLDNRIEQLEAEIARLTKELDDRREQLQALAWFKHEHRNLKSQVASLDAACASLREIANESNAVCACGCPRADHENYGEDGEACEREDHHCYRTSRGAQADLLALRGQIEQLTAACASLKARNEELERKEQAGA